MRSAYLTDPAGAIVDRESLVSEGGRGLVVLRSTALATDLSLKYQ